MLQIVNNHILKHLTLDVLRFKLSVLMRHLNQVAFKVLNRRLQLETLATDLKLLIKPLEPITIEEKVSVNHNIAVGHL